MKVVAYSNEELDVLEGWARKYFKDIKNIDYKSTNEDIE